MKNGDYYFNKYRVILELKAGWRINYSLVLIYSLYSKLLSAKEKNIDANYEKCLKVLEKLEHFLDDDRSIDDHIYESGFVECYRFSKKGKSGFILNSRAKFKGVSPLILYPDSEKGGGLRVSGGVMAVKDTLNWFKEINIKSKIEEIKSEVSRKSDDLFPQKLKLDSLLNEVEYALVKYSTQQPSSNMRDLAC